MLNIFISTLAVNLNLFFPIPAAASASPASIIGYTTSSSSISIQLLWESLQWKVESTIIPGYLFSSPIYPSTTGKDNVHVLTFSLLYFTGETEEANKKTKNGKETQRKP